MINSYKHMTRVCVALCATLPACALLDAPPEFGDVGPCAGVELVTAPACYPDKVVFVAAGAQGGTGTAAQPFGTLPEALVAARARGAQAVVVAGDHTLTAELELVEGVALLGGREPATWQLTQEPSRLTFEIPASEPIARGLVGRQIASLTLVEQVVVELPEAPAGRRAQLGAELVEAAGVKLVRVELKVGRGAQGAPGQPGQPGEQGAEGGQGGGTGLRSGGLAGMTRSCPEGKGSDGGTGGLSQGGQVTPPSSSQTTSAGVPGAAPSSDGQRGAAGAAGQDGIRGEPSSLSATGWQPGKPASAGEPGLAGQGGSGGGGGLVTSGDGTGGGGGGGGAGGCGGAGGAGGQAGTDVVGLVLVGGSPELEDVTLSVGSGGDGGAGGAGGQAGAGGAGGRFALGERAGRAGGKGGDGGAGGVGGAGGAAQGGQSLGVVCSEGLMLRQKNSRISIGSGGKLAQASTTARAQDKLNCL